MPIEISSDLQSRISQIKCLLLDVDGILTDNRTFLDSDGEWKRQFSIRDGYGMVRLKEAGYQIGIITGSKARDIKERAKVLGVHFFHEGSLDKAPALGEICRESGLRQSQVAYMGDDHFDIPVLQQVGFAATAPDAMDEVFHHVHYVARRPAGNGAVREVCELILKFGAYSRGPA